MPLYTPGRRRAILLLLLTSVLLLTLDLRGNALLDVARSTWTQALRPFESAAEVVARPIRNAWRGVTRYDQLVAENRRLEDQWERQISNDVAARALLAELNALKATEALEAAGNYQTVTASVIGPSPSNLDQIIEIDKGRRDGLRVGMPVVTSAGYVIGKVTSRLTDDSAFVMLITDDSYAIGVKVVRPAEQLPEPQFITTTTTTEPPPPPTPSSIEPGDSTPDPASITAAVTTTLPVDPAAPPADVPVDSAVPSSAPTTTVVADPLRETGLLEGQGGGVLPEILLVADTPGFGRPEVGDVVLTAGGTNGLAPPDVLIGQIAEVIPASPSQGLVLHVLPFANVEDLDFVHVILYQPEREASPETASN